MSKITVDENGRIMIPEDERKALGLKPGMTVEIERKGEKLIIKKIIPFKEFITKLKGCITEKSAEKEINPLELKNIWEKSV